MPRLTVLVAGTGEAVDRAVATARLRDDLLVVGTADPWQAAARIVHLRPDLCLCCGTDMGLPARLREAVAAAADPAPTTRFVAWSGPAAVLPA